VEPEPPDGSSEVHLNIITKLTPYLRENTMNLHYKDQLTNDVQGKPSLCSENHMKAKTQNFLILTPTMPNSTTELPARNAKAAWGLMQ
jgi:hypothetical protein